MNDQQWLDGMPTPYLFLLACLYPWAAWRKWSPRQLAERIGIAHLSGTRWRRRGW